MAKAKGTELHEFACMAIRLRIRLKGQGTLALFVNDAISLNMEPEQILYFSPNCFGTADAISFRKDKLRIHDLKTGTVTKAKFEQLKIYAALFCLEYGVRPGEIQIEMRIYQNDEVRVEEANSDEIAHIMDLIISFDEHINKLKEEA